MKNEKIFEAIQKFNDDLMTIDEVNAVLEQEGAKFRLDATRLVIAPEEVEKFGWLDTGTGSFDKVEINPETMELVHGIGDTFAFCKFKDVWYTVEGGKKLVRKPV